MMKHQFDLNLVYKFYTVWLLDYCISVTNSDTYPIQEEKQNTILQMTLVFYWTYMYSEQE